MPATASFPSHDDIPRLLQTQMIESDATARAARSPPSLRRRGLVERARKDFRAVATEWAGVSRWCCRCRSWRSIYQSGRSHDAQNSAPLQFDRSTKWATRMALPRHRNGNGFFVAHSDLVGKHFGIDVWTPHVRSSLSRIATSTALIRMRRLSYV